MKNTIKELNVTFINSRNNSRWCAKMWI